MVIESTWLNLVLETKVKWLCVGTRILVYSNTYVLLSLKSKIEAGIK